MKKLIALLLVLVMVVSVVGCTKAPVDNGENTTNNTENNNTENNNTENNNDQNADGGMTYAEYMAAPMQSQVTVVTYVQATQSWWDNKITAYCQSKDGAYYAYEMACSQEDAAKLKPGTKIKITGTKAEWDGEVEIVDATFEFVEGDKYVAEVFDVTSLLGTDDLIKHMNKKVLFNGMVIDKIEYKNGEPGDDVYITATNMGTTISFCVEIYLTGEDSAVYNVVKTLSEGNIINVEGFLYWYRGANPHVTKITKVFDSETFI